MSDLRRELGFWDALTIGAGTMIGAGIFLLAGVALEMSGPAAIFAYILSGIVCMITASSAAELATGMPTSGGDYFLYQDPSAPPWAQFPAWEFGSVLRLQSPFICMEWENTCRSFCR